MLSQSISQSHVQVPFDVPEYSGNVDNLWGDPSKAKEVLGWNPQKMTYEELAAVMARHDREWVFNPHQTDAKIC